MLATLARNWWAVVLRGVCAILFGLAAFAWPGITLAVLILLWGAYALADGVLAVIWSFMSRGRDSFPWGVFLAGLAAIVAGAFAVLRPGLPAAALPRLLAAWARARR